MATAAYTTPLWALGIDVVFWGVLPGWTSWLGGAIVVGAGLLLVLRSR